MSKELERELDRDVDYWGGCPQCHQNDGYLNARRRFHYYICREHKVKWYVGENLFTAWRDMSEEELKADHKELPDIRMLSLGIPTMMLQNPCCS